MRPRLATAMVFALAAVSAASLSGCGIDAPDSSPEANLGGAGGSSSSASAASQAPRVSSSSQAPAPSSSGAASSSQTSSQPSPTASGEPMPSESAQPVPTATAIPRNSLGALAPAKATDQSHDGTVKKPSTGQAVAPQEGAEDPNYMAGTSTATDCPDGHLTVSRANAVVSLTEDCSRLVVSGDGVVVHAGAVQHIVVTGDGVTVTAKDVDSVEFRGAGGVVLYAGDLPARVDKGSNNMLVPNSAME